MLTFYWDSLYTEVAALLPRSKFNCVTPAALLGVAVRLLLGNSAADSLQE